jgi:uncharacterized MAPEG superfamily protein
MLHLRLYVTGVMGAAVEATNLAWVPSQLHYITCLHANVLQICSPPVTSHFICAIVLVQ